MKAELNTARQVFEEALAAFAQRTRLVGTERYDDLKAEEHYRSFAVAGAMKVDLLADLYSAVSKAEIDGGTLAEFRRDFRDIIARHGWTDWAGEGARHGELWRTRLIYTANSKKSFATGRYVQLTDPAMTAALPYWRWRHSGFAHEPRADHVARDGLTLRYDHPFWQTHFPPRIPPDWNCGCSVEAVRAPGENDITTPPDGWDTDAGDPTLGAAPPGDVVGDIRQFVANKLQRLPPELARDFGEVIESYEIRAGKAGIIPVGPDTPSVRQFEPQRTAPAAAKWAIENDLADFADYTGIKAEVANAWNESLFDHLREFPELRRNQKFVGTAQAQFKRYTEIARAAYIQRLIDKGVPEGVSKELAAEKIKPPRVNGNTYAHSWMQSDVSGIAVNAKFGGQPEHFRAALKRDVANNWHPPGCDSIRSVVDHEIAHQLDALLALKVDSELQAVYNESKRAGIADEVSKYADKNIQEFIAECWAESCNNPKPRSVARTVAGIVRARYRSRFPAEPAS